jgi:prevent-host-death family protein
VEQSVSKSAFKAKALEYFRDVESSGRELVITDHGKPVLKIVPYDRDPMEALKALRGSVLRYDDPLEPVGGGIATVESQCHAAKPPISMR